ncbi:MAG: DegV family protein [Dehalococcoidia bacterium]
MAKIAVVTDSVACIPPDLIAQYGIHVAAVQVIWDRKTYRDGIDMTMKEFYQRLRTDKTLPTTSSAIQGDYIEIYESLNGKVDGIVVIALSGTLGASYSTAISAAEIVTGTPIEVIDTSTAMLSQGFIVLEAAKVAAKGGTMQEVVQAARDAIPKVTIFFAMDTLEYMRRGGRVSLPQAVLASWLKVKPIMSIETEDGKIHPLERTRTKPKAVEKLFEIMAQRVKGTGPLHVGVIHGDIPDEAESLKARIQELYKPVEILVNEITPVVGTHLGPGALGISLYEE